jgi:hypothetical protein
LESPTHPDLEPLVRVRPVVLVALADMTALERIVLSGALESLGRDRGLHYLLHEQQAVSLRAAAPTLGAENSTACGADAPALAALFDRWKPVYCIVPTPLDPWSRGVASACEAENVACLVLQTGVSDLSGPAGIEGPVPFLGCWGPQAKDDAVERLHLRGRRVVALGAPQHRWLMPPPAAAAAALRARLGVGDAGRLLLFWGSRGAFDELGALRDIDRAIASGTLESLRVVYRPHDTSTSAAFAGRAWQHVVLGPDGASEAAAAALMAAADAIIAPLSSPVVIEALLLEKPVLAIAYGVPDTADASPDPRLAPVRESSAVLLCEDPSRLLRECARLFEPRWDDKTIRARTKLLDRLLTREPGSYADRLMNFSEQHIDKLGRKMRAQRTGGRATISHIYGADLIAHEYTGVAGDAVVPGYWMHGWLPEYHNVHPALVAMHKKEGQVEGYDFAAQIVAEKQDQPQWVARGDQAAFLRQHGYRHARAIGLPIVYLPVPPARRVPRSLLVLPPHSHRIHGPGDPLAAAYADAIAGVRHRFEHVWVGVSEGDMSERQWVDAFRARGIGVFTTSDRGDSRTLLRLRRILSTFEYVTTNGFGSHIAMAAYCGAKVSVFGPFAPFPPERMAVTHAVKIHPDLLDAACELCTEAAVRQHYPFLFVEPDEAVARTEWGAAEVGEPCRVSPQELRRLFGWEAA